MERLSLAAQTFNVHTKAHRPTFALANQRIVRRLKHACPRRALVAASKAFTNPCRPVPSYVPLAASGLGEGDVTLRRKSSEESLGSHLEEKVNMTTTTILIQHTWYKQVLGTQAARVTPCPSQKTTERAYAEHRRFWCGGSGS